MLHQFLTPSQLATVTEQAFAAAEITQLFLGDGPHDFGRQWRKGDDVIQAVEELRLESLAHSAQVVDRFIVSETSSRTTLCPDVAGHQNNRVAKRSHFSKAIRQASFIENAKQDVKHFGGSFLDFIKQQDTQWSRANLLNPACGVAVSAIQKPKTRVQSRILTHVEPSQSTTAIRCMRCRTEQVVRQ